MEFIQSDFKRFSFFILITMAEVLLAIFLLFHGSENLKIFAIFLLMAQLLSMHRVHVYLSNMEIPFRT